MEIWDGKFEIADQALLANNAGLTRHGKAWNKAVRNETRDRRRPLRVVVSQSERSRIEERARFAGLSVSAYLRAAGLCHPIRSSFDHAAVVELAKVNGDQGRLGGLLKLWLADRPGTATPPLEIRLLLDRIAELQRRLAEIAGRM